ncbi:MAG TPA: glycosyltransferase family 39 protein [Chloroflexota bacterium]
MLGLILLGAFGARVWELGVKSLWLDEGISVAFSLDGPPRLFQTLVERDLHPPLYYLALHGWMRLAGQSETAVRFPSVIVGVLLVGLVYRFARQLYDGWPSAATGALAAALLAGSPFLVFYAQEARMYGALALAGLAATSALWWALGRSTAGRPGIGGLGPWLLYGLLLALPPYLHHFGWLVLAVHAAFVLLTLRRYRRRALGWLAGVAFALLLYLPWLPSAARQIARLRDTPDFWRGALSLWFVVQHAFAAFAVGFGGALDRYPLVLALFVGVFLLGAAFVVARGVLAGRSADLLLALYLVVPLLLLYAAVAGNPKFADRYLIVVVPPFALLLARGLTWVGELGVRLRRARPALGVVVIGCSVVLALGVVGVSAREAQRVYDGEDYAKEDFRGTVDYLFGHWQEGDVALLMIDSWQAFDYYSHGRLGRYGFGPTDDVAFAARELNAIVDRGHRRLWVVFWNPDWADPSGSIRALLDETATRLPLDNPGLRGLPLRLYSLADHPRFSTGAEPSQPIGVDLGGRLRLIGRDGDLTRPLEAGASRRLALYWAPLRELTEDLQVSYRLVAGGHEWWRHDARPAAHTYPTLYWKPGRSVRGTLELTVPPGTPPGRYTLKAVVYDAATGAELPVGGDEPVGSSMVTIGQVEVAPPAVPPPVEALDVPAAPERSLDGLALVALAPVPPTVEAGGTLEFVAGWRGQGLTADRLVEVGLEDGAGVTWLLSSRPPGGEAYPTSRWRAGELVVDRRTLVVPAGAAAGTARMWVRARDPGAATGQSTAEPLAEIEVRNRARNTRPPAPLQPTSFGIGEHARLVGYDAPRSVERGGVLKVVLHWQAVADTRTAYAVFVHLIDANERPLAQRDGAPGGGALPTTGWLPGEYLADEHAVPIPADLAPGEYRLAVGMYEPTAGRRAPVTGPSGRQPNDRALLGTVVVR